MNPVKMALALVGAATIGPATIASATSEPPEPSAPVDPVVLEPMTPRSTFPDDVSISFDIALDGAPSEQRLVEDPDNVVVVRVTVQPGASLPWNTHTGPVLIIVNEGEIAYVDGDDCSERDYAAGTAFIDPGGGVVHTIHNPSDDVTVLTSTFLAAPVDGPLIVTEGVATPACA